MLPESMRAGAPLAADSRLDSLQELGLAAAVENYNSAAILSEQSSSETRVVTESDRARRALLVGEKQEIAAAFDVARRKLAEPAPFVDRNGIPFILGARVNAFDGVWYGAQFIPAGTEGVFDGMGARCALVLFPELHIKYLVARDRMALKFEVVK